MTPARKVALLPRVQPLLQSLEQAPVPVVGETDPARAVAATGVPGFAASNVVSFLHRHRDLQKLGEFVERLADLDLSTAPNEQNPRAHHAALREILLPWLGENRDLSAEETLYVLAWVRRLLPDKSKDAKKEIQKPVRSQRRPVRAEKARVFEPPEVLGGNQMARKLQEAMDRKNKKNKRKSSSASESGDE